MNRNGAAGDAGEGRPADGDDPSLPRWILLEHVGAPDDPAGRHFDLLLEAGAACRTWRLAALPEAGGPAVAAVEIAPHRLAWLDHMAGEVSGGRGFARRVAGGRCRIVEPADGAVATAPRVVIRTAALTLTVVASVTGGTAAATA